MNLYGFISSSETFLSSAWKYFVESEGIKILFFLLHPVSIGLKAIKPNLDSSLINNLGWKAKTTLEDGLNLTYNWFKKNI